ncbi:MAG: MerR family transcriptional regulator [Alphaproteobacteria bacterium]
MQNITSLRSTASIGELAKATGCKIETIRYYERIGVMPLAPRSEGGHRIYDQVQMKRLNFVCRSRALGFSLKQVRDLLSLADGGKDSCAEIKALTLEHLTKVRRKIADLQRMETVLAETAAKCVGNDLPDCPIAEVLYN